MFLPRLVPTPGPFPSLFSSTGADLSAETARPTGTEVVEQKCVFVTIQYRLGPLGFFSTGDDACEDNIGLWDMKMALDWVQENIGQFGGDKHNVTLMGQSAGAVSVDLLALSPHTRDLFHKIIPMGGIANCSWAMANNAVDRCREVAQQLGIYTTDSKEMMQRLRQVPAHKLGMDMLLGGRQQFGTFQCPRGLGPRMDGKFFPKPLEELRKESEPKGRLVGLCQLEGLFFMLGVGRANLTLSKVQEIIARQIPESKFPENFHQLRKEALNMYLRGEMEKMSGDREAQVRAVAEIMSDLFVGIALQEQLDQRLAMHPDKGGQCFVYTFDYVNPRLLSLLGLIFNGRFPMKACTHSCELFYLFRNADFNFFGRRSIDEEDEKLVRIVTKMWANFAKFGDPNGSEQEPQSLLGGAFSWDPVTKEHPSRNLSIKLEPEMRESLQADRPKRWIELLGREG